RRTGRHGRHARGGCAALGALAAAVAGAGDRARLRHDQSGRRRRCLADRQLRAGDALGGAAGARRGLRGGRARERSALVHGAGQARAAQLLPAGAGAGRGGVRHGGAGGLGAELPRLRRETADAGVGFADLRGPQLPGLGVVDDHAARPGDRDRRARGPAPRPGRGPEGTRVNAQQALLAIDGLRVDYTTGSGPVPALRDASLRVGPGEVVALVGESGSGKSTLAHAVIGLLPSAARIGAGSITFDGTRLDNAPERVLRGVRGARIGFVPQDPGLSLNPVRRIGDQIAESLLVHGLADGRGARERTLELLDEVGLDRSRRWERRYPHEL